MDLMKTLWPSITVITGLTMAILPIFHIIKMNNEKSSKGQSVIGVIGLLIGLIVWFIYGIFIKDRIITSTNGINIITNFIYLATVVYWKNK